MPRAAMGPSAVPEAACPPWQGRCGKTHEQPLRGPSPPRRRAPSVLAHALWDGAGPKLNYFCSSAPCASLQAGSCSPSPTSSHSLALESLRARTRGAGDGNEPGEDFFITFLNVLLIARSGADVVCLMMHRQAAAPNP